MTMLPSVRIPGGITTCVQKNNEENKIVFPQSMIDTFAKVLLPLMREYYASEEGQREYEAWKKQEELIHDSDQS